jgi:hypothetical protein
MHHHQSSHHANAIGKVADVRIGLIRFWSLCFRILLFPAWHHLEWETCESQGPILHHIRQFGHDRLSLGARAEIRIMQRDSGQIWTSTTSYRITRVRTFKLCNGLAIITGMLIMESGTSKLVELRRSPQLPNNRLLKPCRFNVVTPPSQQMYCGPRA